MQSLHGRLLLAATLALAGFLGATGVALYQAFRDSAQAAQQERLLGQVYALLAAANEDKDGRMLLPQALPDPKLNNPASGFYAMVRSADGDFEWRSPSLTGHEAGFLSQQPPGQRSFGDARQDAQVLRVINFGLAWEDYGGNDVAYTFAVAMDKTPLRREIEGFRAALWGWLGGLALILLLVQGGILRWGLKPLRKVTDDLRAIEAGRADRLEGEYPQELRGLTGNLNALIASSKANQERFRNRLDDLAHSMKTPLAILRNAADDQREGEFDALVREQVQRMDDIVQHQLRRAVASGRSTLGRAVEVAPLVRRLARSLEKVYRDKSIATELALSSEARFFGDQADLLEILGNLMENACKYGRSRVRVAATLLTGGVNARPGLELRVEDDGPGVDPRQADRIMQRGRRMDQSKPGQGIGLSVAAEIVAVYGGEIRVERSELGGAAFVIRFPVESGGA